MCVLCPNNRPSPSDRQTANSGISVLTNNNCQRALPASTLTALPATDRRLRLQRSPVQVRLSPSFGCNLACRPMRLLVFALAFALVGVYLNSKLGYRFSGGRGQIEGRQAKRLARSGGAVGPR